MEISKDNIQQLRYDHLSFVPVMHLHPFQIKVLLYNTSAPPITAMNATIRSPRISPETAEAAAPLGFEVEVPDGAAAADEGEAPDFPVIPLPFTTEVTV